MRDLVERLGLTGERDLWFVGSGGKTTLMLALARYLAQQGERVVVTTTTRMWPVPERQEVPTDGVGDARASLVVCAAGRSEEGKLLGIEPEQAMALSRAERVNRVLVEADGSAGRPLKAHAEHEPVVSPDASLVLVVIGLGALGQPWRDDVVHRAALARQRLGLDSDAAVRPQDIARLLAHPDGLLARLPLSARLVLCLAGESPPDPAMRDLVWDLPGVERVVHLPDLSGKGTG